MQVNASGTELWAFSLNQIHTDAPAGSGMTVSEFSNSHSRQQGWQGHSSCLVSHMHAHTLTHRCSLFSQAAINLHARGYEFIGGRERETESQRGLFKVNRGEQVSFLWSDLLGWQSTPTVPCMSGPGDGPGWWWWWGVGGSVTPVTPVTHENVNCLVVVSNRSTRGHWDGQ